MVKVNQTLETGTEKSRISVSLRLLSIVFLTSAIGSMASVFFSSGILLIGIVATVLFVSTFVAQTFFLQDRQSILYAVIANTLSITLPFYKLLSPLLFIAALILGLFLLAGLYRGQRAAKNSIRIEFTRIGRIISSSTITAIALFLSAVLVISSNFTISSQQTSSLLQFAAIPAKYYVKDFSPEMSAREFFISLAEDEAEGRPEFQALPESLQERVVDQSALELEMKIEEFIGTDIHSNLSVSENVHRVIQFRLQSLTTQAKIYLGATAILLIWLSVKSIEVILFLPIVFLAYLIYELLLALGFARVEERSASQEVLVVE